MKLLLITVCMFASSAFSDNQWNRYKAKHNKVYTSQQENDRRLEQYLKNKEMVEEHNRKYERGGTTYTMGINHFSDWFPEEIDKMLGPKLDKNRPSGGQKFELPPGTPVPDSINWVEKGAVTSVKNQGKCNADYAFVAAGALEGLLFRTNNTIVDLSAQELIDCSSNHGCEDGFDSLCYEYVQTRNGIDTDESYPYKGVQTTCRANEGTIGATCTGYVCLMDEAHLMAAVGTVGPTAVAFSADNSLLHYKSGIFTGTCASYPTLMMLAVGYGTDNITHMDYWLVKNSWGQNWGEKGYVRIEKGVSMCDIGCYCTYPVYQKKPSEV